MKNSFITEMLNVSIGLSISAVELLKLINNEDLNIK